MEGGRGVEAPVEGRGGAAGAGEGHGELGGVEVAPQGDGERGGHGCADEGECPHEPHHGVVRAGRGHEHDGGRPREEVPEEGEGAERKGVPARAAEGPASRFGALARPQRPDQQEDAGSGDDKADGQEEGETEQVEVRSAGAVQGAAPRIGGEDPDFDGAAGPDGVGQPAGAGAAGARVLAREAVHAVAFVGFAPVIVFVADAGGVKGPGMPAPAAARVARDTGIQDFPGDRDQVPAGGMVRGQGIGEHSGSLHREQRAE